MCKYCDANELQEVYDTMDKIYNGEIDYDYYCEHEGDFTDLLKSHSIMTTYGFDGITCYFIDGRFYYDGGFSTWNNSVFNYCPVCGHKLN